MKAVMISIQPKWCELIANGKKTIEVRKTKPNLKTPFKCYIYATKHKRQWLRKLCTYGREIYITENIDVLGRTEKVKSLIGGDTFIENGGYNGKVIGEFVCDEIECLEEHIEEGGLYYTLQSTFNEMAQLDNWELHDYGKGKPLFGWHISNLVIYDKPKKLDEFQKICNHKEDCCTCKRRDSKNFDCIAGISRPPQNWCYVEEYNRYKEIT